MICHYLLHTTRETHMTAQIRFSKDGEILSPLGIELEIERERERDWFAPGGPQDQYDRGIDPLPATKSIGRGDCEGCSTTTDLFDGYVNGYGDVQVCLPCLTGIDADNSAEYQMEHNAEMGIERYYESRFDDGSRLDDETPF